MIAPKILLVSVLLIFLHSKELFGQKNKNKQYKFGQITEEDFRPVVYALDSTADAVVLAEIGESKFVGNNKGDFSIEFNYHKRIRLLSKKSFDEANIIIPLYISEANEEEKIESFEAVTYNIENGQIVNTKLEKGAIYKERYDKKHLVWKFTFPNIKEGSIIEYRYKMVSPFYFNFQPWTFQGDLPVLWSEYKAIIPNDIFSYVMLKQGYLPYVIDTAKVSTSNYNILAPGDKPHESPQLISFRSNTVEAHWAMQNVPPLKSESFITTLDNYKAKISFQLKRITYSPGHFNDFMGNWDQLVERLSSEERFGEPLSKNNGWLVSQTKGVMSGANSDYEKAKLIYEYVRDNYICKKRSGIYMTAGLKKINQEKNGNVADINLLLVAMLKANDINAAPALLSTRDNGRANETYPLIDKFDYVICRAQIGENTYLLDATDKNLGFGKLPEELYNGSARLIDKTPLLIPLSPDSLTESKVTSVFIINGNKGMDGTLTSRLGYFESKDMRESIGKNGKDEVFKAIQKQYPAEIEASKFEIDSLAIKEVPISVKYDININWGDQDVVYFSPMLAEATKTNPFKSAERIFPVEMPYCMNEMYLFNMQVPTGYKVEEIPKSTKVSLNGNEGMFEYIVAANATHIQLRCHITLKKATFDPDDYQTLRDFFGLIVSKQSEQVVLRKVK